MNKDETLDSSPVDEGYVTEASHNETDGNDTSDVGPQDEPDASGYYDSDDADENGNLANFVVDDEDDGNKVDVDDGDENVEYPGEDIRGAENLSCEGDGDADVEDHEMEVEEIEQTPRYVAKQLDEPQPIHTLHSTQGACVETCAWRRNSKPYQAVLYFSDGMWH